jgi:hypothetical protein
MAITLSLVISDEVNRILWHSKLSKFRPRKVFRWNQRGETNLDVVTDPDFDVYIQENHLYDPESSEVSKVCS